MPPSKTKTAPLSGARLLLVEDQAVIALDLEELLLQRGAAMVSWARDLGQARSLLAAGGQFDAGLLDIDLGGESGLDLLDELGSLNIPVVLISGYSGDFPGRESLKGHAIVEKPYDPEVLLGAVAEAVKRGTSARS